MNHTTAPQNTARNLIAFPATARPLTLAIGQIVSYEDRANPMQKAVVIDLSDGRQTCVFEDGHKSQVRYTDCDGSCGWRKHSEILSAEEMEAFLTRAATAKQTKIEEAASAKIEAEKEHAEQTAKLIAEFQMLERQGGKYRGQVLAARNIRKLLKLNFPGMKFEVTSQSYSGGNSVSVHWENGPTTAEVEKITGKFQAGSFDGMEDIYRYESSAFTDLFGEAKYVQEQRHVTDDKLREIADEMGYAGTPVVHGDIQGQDYHTNEAFRRRWYSRSFYTAPSTKERASKAVTSPVHAPVLCW